MENSTLVVLIYVLIILLVWLIGIRRYEKELFIGSTSNTGLHVFCSGIFWPASTWLVLMNEGGPLIVKLLKKMHNIKF
tara:strand:+ start:72 stop:305 length:234 start_codon:yes stop_codon:yes gene_type:complete